MPKLPSTEIFRRIKVHCFVPLSYLFVQRAATFSLPFHKNVPFSFRFLSEWPLKREEVHDFVPLSGLLALHYRIPYIAFILYLNFIFPFR